MICVKDGLVVFFVCDELVFDIFGVGYFLIVILVGLGMVLVRCY